MGVDRPTDTAKRETPDRWERHARTLRLVEEIQKTRAKRLADELLPLDELEAIRRRRPR